MTSINEKTVTGETIVTTLIPMGIFEELNGRTVIGWVAWYPGPVIYRSDQVKWEDVPMIGCQAMRIFYNKADGSFGRENIQGAPAFLIDKVEDITPANIAKRVKIGKLIPDDQYLHISDLLAQFDEDIKTTI
jgi:hypothetical protein